MLALATAAWMNLRRVAFMRASSRRAGDQCREEDISRDLSARLGGVYKFVRLDASATMGSPGSRKITNR
jgi:hypothetical protein